MPEDRFDFEDWDVESLRMSIFCPANSNPIERSGLWEKVTGEQPSSIDSRPREGVTREVGVVGGNNLLLVTQRSRLDWLLQPVAVPDQRAPVILTLKDVGNARGIFRKAFRYSLETIGLALRLAFAPVLIKDVASVSLGFGQLSVFLPRLDLAPLNTPDFIYRVNRRRRSLSVPHAEINRIAKWSMEEVGAVSFRVTPSGRPDFRDTGTAFVRKLELDVNTTPETSAMSKDKISGLLDEMITIAEELATEGDVS